MGLGVMAFIDPLVVEISIPNVRVWSTVVNVGVSELGYQHIMSGYDLLWLMSGIGAGDMESY